MKNSGRGIDRYPFCSFGQLKSSIPRNFATRTDSFSMIKI